MLFACMLHVNSRGRTSWEFSNRFGDVINYAGIKNFMVYWRFLGPFDSYICLTSNNKSLQIYDKNAKIDEICDEFNSVFDDLFFEKWQDFCKKV